MTNKKLERLLVIEDTPSHLKDAKRFFEAVQGLRTEYVTTANEAIGERGLGGKLYQREPSDDNPEWYAKIKKFIRQQGFSDDYKKRTEAQARRIVTYGDQLEAQGIPRTIGGGITPLVDGVITDLFFPILGRGIQGLDDAPNGLLVVATCKGVEIPCVICTAGYHHGRKYEWANLMNRAMGNPDMVDCYTPGNNDAEGQHKNWKAAYETLKEIVEG